MPLRFVDAHLHLGDSRLLAQAERLVAKAEGDGVQRFFCNAATESEWETILELSHRNPQIIPFLGIHPWYCQGAEAGWQHRLAELIASFPTGIGLGETGLDKNSSADRGTQLAYFNAHLNLALSEELPLSIHCVNCWGPLIDILENVSKNEGLPPIMIHSFSGSTESMFRLARLGCFISFSASIADPRRKKLQETFKQVPLSSLLLETDAPDGPTPPGIGGKTTAGNEPSVVIYLYQRAASLRGLTLNELTNQVWQNAAIYAHTAFSR